MSGEGKDKGSVDLPGESPRNVPAERNDVNEKESDHETNESAEKDNEVVIYYFPTSYSSQKVLICISEKQLKFKPSVVSLFHRQHMEPWYVRLNPNGAHVPVLVHGSQVINDPDKIIDYIDKMQDNIGPQLSPPKTSLVGQQVAKFRESIEKIPMDVISYGIIFHPDLSESGCQLPVAIQRSMRENFTNRLRHLVNLSTKHPDLRDFYLAKSQTAAEKYDLITDEEKVKGHLEQLNSLLVKVEKELNQRYNVEECDGLDSMFLFGDDLTAADVGLYVLITRMQILGLMTQMMPQVRYPLTLRHYTLMAARPSVAYLSKEMSKLRYTLLVEDVKASSSYLALAFGTGMVLVAAYYLVKHISKS